MAPNVLAFVFPIIQRHVIHEPAKNEMVLLVDPWSEPPTYCDGKITSYALHYRAQTPQHVCFACLNANSWNNIQDKPMMVAQRKDLPYC